MELNKNKLIFGIIGGILLALIIFMAFVLNNSSSDKNKKNTDVSNQFIIWTYLDDSSKGVNFINDFKEKNPEYKSKNIILQSFGDYEEYSYALMSALSKGKGPDIFVLNNNEKDPIFLEQAVGINPEEISPGDFRKKFKTFFADDLIKTTDFEGEQKDFLVGIPVGYETLGIFYNLTKVNSSYLKNMSTLYNNSITILKKKYPDLVPIAIGNGTTVDYAADIATQFFMLEGDISSINGVTNNEIKQALGTYLSYGDSDRDNSYNSRYVELKNLGETGVYLFSRGETFMLAGYPRLVEKIAEKGFSKAYLQAAPFPHYFGTQGKALVNYNYFVVNKDSKNNKLAVDFLKYLTTDSGAEAFLNSYKYYLPALISLESDIFDDKIHDKFNVQVGDFYNENYIYSSFDKGIKNIYDKNLENLLDNSTTYLASFLKFKQSILCKTRKVINLENISADCN